MLMILLSKARHYLKKRPVMLSNDHTTENVFFLLFRYLFDSSICLPFTAARWLVYQCTEGFTNAVTVDSRGKLAYYQLRT